MSDTMDRFRIIDTTGATATVRHENMGQAFKDLTSGLRDLSNGRFVVEFLVDGTSMDAHEVVEVWNEALKARRA